MAGEPAPFVSVVVPVRNGERTIAGCLASLVSLDYPPSRREILVVDNASSDGTAGIVERFPVTYLREERVGRAHARNRGIEASTGDPIAFLDADCVASPQWLAELVRAFEPGVDGVAGEILPHRPGTPAERYMARRRERWQIAAYTHERPFAITANVAFTRRTFQRVGLFDPLYVTSEDVDLSYRFFAAGLDLRYSAEAVVHHRHRPTGRELFAQQYWLGYGRALARSRYRLPQASYELERWGRLGLALLGLLAAPARLGAGRARSGELADAFYEVVLLSGNRLGALQWHLAGRFRRGRSGKPRPSSAGS